MTYAEEEEKYFSAGAKRSRKEVDYSDNLTEKQWLKVSGGWIFLLIALEFLEWEMHVNLKWFKIEICLSSICCTRSDFPKFRKMYPNGFKIADSYIGHFSWK